MAAFNGGLSGGIVPGGAIGAQLSAITRRAAVPSVFVQIYQAHPLTLTASEQRSVGQGRYQPGHHPRPGREFRPVFLGFICRRLPDAGRRSCNPERPVQSQTRHVPDWLLRNGSAHSVERGHHSEASRRHVGRRHCHQAELRQRALFQQLRQHAWPSIRSIRPMTTA